jgi:FAD/FMN-containing dehydrogenase
MDLNNPEAHKQIPEIQQKVFELVFEYGGSMAGEHNDGLKCAPFLKLMFGDRMYGVFEEIKRIFDPENVFNPRKKVGVTLDYSAPLIKGGAGIKGNQADYLNFNK